MTAAAAAAAGCAALWALAGCGSSDKSEGSSGKGKASTAEGDPTAAKVAAATRGLHTARFQGSSTTVGNRYKWRSAANGRIDRDRKRSVILVPDTMHGTGATTEYRVFGRTAYLRQLTPRRGRWVRQNLRTQGPAGSLPLVLGTGAILGFPLHLVDPLKKVSEGSVHGTHATQYSAEVSKSSADASLNSGRPSGPIRIWLDGRNYVRRIRVSTGSASQDPALGSIAEQVSVDFWAINRPVKVARPR